MFARSPEPSWHTQAAGAWRRPCGRALAWLIALLLGVLNPLACALHCAWALAATPDAGARPAPAFICAVHRTVEGDAVLAGTHPQAPRAVYEAALPATLHASVPPRVMVWRAPVCLGEPQTNVVPPVPPPRGDTSLACVLGRSLL